MSFNSGISVINVVRSNTRFAVEPTEESVPLFRGSTERFGKFRTFIKRYGSCACIFAAVRIDSEDNLFNVSCNEFFGMRRSVEYCRFGNGNVGGSLLFVLVAYDNEFPTDKSVTRFYGNG